MRRLAALLAALLLAACSGGGGGAGSGDLNVTLPALGAAQLAVLIRQGDLTSEAIGLAYQRAHAVPEINMIRLAVPAGNDVISDTDFATLKAALDLRLPGTVQATLVTWMQPSRVQGPSCTMGLTSALAFGYATSRCGGCGLTEASPYYNSDSTAPWTDLQVRPSMMLGTATLTDAQALIARGVAAEGIVTRGSATGQAWLVRTSDAARSVRFTDFQVLASSRVAGLSMHYVDNSAGSASDIVSDQGDVMLYLTGLSDVPQIASNRYLPGAVADSLTSTAGMLPSGGGQMPITAWLQAGATGSYGTVEEPCNFTEKFPRATVLAKHYSRGESLVEVYWKSVERPGQGLFVGDPLARPWAQ